MMRTAERVAELSASPLTVRSSEYGGLGFGWLCLAITVPLLINTAGQFAK